MIASGLGAAAPPENPDGDTSTARLNSLGDDELLIDEVFQSHLPTTLQKYRLRLSVHPHLGDWQNKDNMRLTTTIRYGLSGNCEISAGSNLFFSHGHGNVGTFDDYGAADLRLGVKFNLGEPLFSGWDTGAGFEFDTPTGRPPVELTDGLRHFKPYVTFSHRLRKHEHLRIFWGVRMDQVTHTSLQGEFSRNALRDGSIGFTGGWVIDREQWHYTFEASLDTSRVINSTTEDVFTVRPGVIWEIPSRRDPHLRSNWMVGIALSGTVGPGGTSTGASLKVRYSRDLKNPIRTNLTAPLP